MQASLHLFLKLGLLHLPTLALLVHQLSPLLFTQSGCVGDGGGDGDGGGGFGDGGDGDGGGGRGAGGGGGDGDGGGGDGSEGDAFGSLAQMVQPAAVTDTSENQVIDSPAVMSTPEGP